VLGGLILIRSIVVYAESRAERDSGDFFVARVSTEEERERRRERTVATSRVGISYRASERAVTATRRNRVSSFRDEMPVAAALCA